MDFFPQVDAGQMRLHVRAPPATRMEDTQHYFASVESAIRDIVGDDQIEVLLDNIGLPYSATNTGLSDSATVGPMDGEILISLKEKHSPTPAHMARLRHDLPERFPQLQFFFQPADIVNQVLNFGRQAPVDIRISGPKSEEAYSVAAKLATDLRHVPGIVDSHVYQVPDAPALTVEVDRYARPRGWPGPAGDRQQSARFAQQQPAGRAEFLAEPAEQRELSAGGADAGLSHRHRRKTCGPFRWVPGRARTGRC